MIDVIRIGDSPFHDPSYTGGYNHIEHFIRQFKQIMKYTPYKYKRISSSVV